MNEFDHCARKPVQYVDVVDVTEMPNMIVCH